MNFTIFTTAKPFEGHIGIIQRNAIRSWTRLKRRPEIIILGNEQGSQDIARELGLIHIPEVEFTRRGAPILGSIFRKAKQTASNKILCYVNADIILFDEFIDCVSISAQRFEKFLGIGRRWGLKVDRELEFEPGWQEKLNKRLYLEGRKVTPFAIDYLVFHRDMYKNVKPFALGRGAWDTWLVYMARASGIPIVDFTRTTKVIHQDHDYQTTFKKLGMVPTGKEITDIDAGWSLVTRGIEIQDNRRLAAGLSLDIETGSTHYVMNNSIRRKSRIIRCIKILLNKCANRIIQLSEKDADVKAIWNGIRTVKKKVMT